MSLVLCNIGHGPRSRPTPSQSDQNCVNPSGASGSNASGRRATTNAVHLPSSSSASALNRGTGGMHTMHTSPSSSTINHTTTGNDNNNNTNTKSNYNEADDPNQVTIYR